MLSLDGPAVDADSVWIGRRSDAAHTLRSVTDPRRDPDPAEFLHRFAWHEEPELIGFRDEATSRAALERLGAATWSTALDFLYDHALQRAMGEPADYERVRDAFYGDRG